MRIPDAEHLDCRGFYARLLELGGIFRLLGYLGCMAVMFCVTMPFSAALPWVSLAVVVLWFAAWYAQVGALWRGSIVAALVSAATALSVGQLQAWGVL